MKVKANVKLAAVQLCAVQARIAKVRRQLAQLEAQESELSQMILPVFSSEPISRHTEISYEGENYVVKYGFVERLVVNVPAVEKHYASLGKKVPRKHQHYSTLRVVKS